jgi:hypothetical protein
MTPIIGVIDSSKSGHLGPAPFPAGNWIANVISSGAGSPPNINITVRGGVKTSYAYSGGGGNGVGNYPAYWALTSDGTFAQKKYLSNYGTWYVDGVTGDSNGNVYIAYSGGGNGGLTKINSSGTVQWSKTYGFTYFSLFELSPDETKLICRVSSYEQDSPVLINATDGSVIWGRNAAGGGFGTFNCTGGAFNSNYIYTCNYQRNGTNYGSIRKLDYNGTAQWSNYYSSTGGSVGIGVFTDVNDNSYTYGYTGSSSYFTKFNSAGSAQWTKYFGSGQQFPQLGCADSSGNIYTGHNDGTKAYIIKLDSSGNVQWQRSLTGSAGTSNSGGIYLINNSNIYVTFSASDGSAVNAYQAVLPTDGSKTGTYTVGGKTVVYAASSLSIGGQNNGWGSTINYSSYSVTASNNTTPTIANLTNSTGLTNI